MIDYTLRFPSEADAMLALYSDGNPATDIIGAIDGATGWHVNVRSEEELPELEAYRVYPLTPVRVWA